MSQRLRRKLKGTNVRPFTVYLSEDLDTWLRNMARAEGRTLSMQTELVLAAGRQTMEERQVA